MSDLTKGYTFSGTSPNNNVTAEKLNALVDDARISTGFLTGKAEVSTAADGDFLLLYDVAGGTFRKIRKANLITAGVAQSGFVNLRIATNATAPTAKLDVTADEIVMRSSSGNVRHAVSFSRTLDSGSYTGGPTPDGRDFSSEGANTWYYIWAISDGLNERTLLSASATSPNMPEGFAYKALLGCVRNDNASNFVPFVQRNRDVVVQLASLAGVSNPQLNPWTSNAGDTSVEFTEIARGINRNFAPIDLSRCVPPGIAGRVSGVVGSTFDNGQNNTYIIATAGSGSAAGSPASLIGAQAFVCYSKATLNQLLGFIAAASFETVISQTGAPVIWWAVHNGSTENEKHSMRITGYTLSL